MRNKWVRVGLVVVALGGLAAFLTIYVGAPESSPVGTEAARMTEHWIDVVRRRAQPGYWIVVRGTHIGDQVVAAGSAGELTHAAIYDPDEETVIEAVGSGVHEEPIRELLAQSVRFQIIRPIDWSEREGAQALERARGHVGFSYDFLGTIGLQDDRRYYCTELCLDAYRARERGWMPPGVIHPEHMERYGELVFDSGLRPSSSAVAQISDELEERFATAIRDARGTGYAAEVAPGILRGGQPDAEGVQWLRAHGVRTVINLRHFHGDSEGELVREAGMRYVRIPLESTDAPEAESIRRFFAIVNNPEARPVYVHCLHGVDRTGTMIALYRIREQGWNNADALAEMERFGAHELLHDLRRFVGTFTP